MDFRLDKAVDEIKVESKIEEVQLLVVPCLEDIRAGENVQIIKNVHGVYAKKIKREHLVREGEFDD